MLLRGSRFQFLGINLAPIGQQKQVAPARTPSTPICLGFPRNPNLSAGGAIPVTARIVLLSRFRGDCWHGSIARVVVRISIRKKTCSLAARAGAFSKDSVVQGHDVSNSFQATRANDEACVEHQIQSLGGLLNRVGRNDQVFITFRIGRILQYNTQGTTIDWIRGRSCLWLRCLVLLEGLSNGDGIISHGLVANSLHNGRQLCQVKIIRNIIPRKG
mmetsp:Transcript_10970/g.27782  ORF Transcript_10970/g.27782 Transcript_10970/m.27782 type:complete len:216 (-) Transcript_10970:649-1296(-)